MLDAATVHLFDTVYSTNLVYIPNCARLCGDAHCCNFSRYKTRFRLIARTHFQELPLLPGEYEYLASRRWLEQFGDFDHRVVPYQIDHRSLRIESIVSRKPGCACDHDTRPTVCRLYPLLPVFDCNGLLTGTESFGIYEELESLDGLQPACQLTYVPFEELQKFLAISYAVGQSPRALYYVSAYRLFKNHVRARLVALMEMRQASAFQVFERGLIKEELVNHTELKRELIALADKFEARWGNALVTGSVGI